MPDGIESYLAEVRAASARNRAQEASHARALKLIALYADPSNHYTKIAAEMGWDTKWPKQMVTKELHRLRARGYEIPTRS